MTIYFYKVEDPYGYFSNFSPHGIHMKGQDWQTVEHYYQAQKYLGSPHQSVMQSIAAAPTPEAAAALGRDRSLIVRADWEDVKRQVMQSAVLRKFLTHLDIQAKLLATGDEILVENSAKDYYWGCGADRTGYNYLGKTLMAVRAEIKQRLNDNT